MSKVGIIGHYGFGLDLANGQTIKTKIITDELRKTDHELVTVDAHGGIKAVLPVVFGCIKCLSSCDDVLILLTENGLRVAVPVLAILNRLAQKKLHYIVIGGWLSSFLDRAQSLKRFLQSFDYIYVETNTMKTALESKGFSNIVIMPNCKKLKILSEEELIYSSKEPLALCTFSRVMKEKGIETIVHTIKKVNDTIGRKAYRLDIYGQIDDAQKQWFVELQRSFPTYISYGGIVPFDESVEVLKNYFALIFPTHFYTEGIPGTIIDSYAAGVPVISAKWESFSDVIDDGQTGIGYEFDNASELESILENTLRNPERLNSLKTKCIEKAKEYTLKETMKILMERL
jgi:glycosyltransferase involved in cell wall biosynthesis